MTPCQTAHLLTYCYIIVSYNLALLSSIPTGWLIYHSQSAPASLGIWVTLSNLVHAVGVISLRSFIRKLAPVLLLCAAAFFFCAAEDDSPFIHALSFTDKFNHLETRRRE